ncbi:hypothetical protein JW916_05040 [Candidatus Sumerlaeota bacterium]|nr:hypothetical protein [Candidatus Sumerlaeota bacterium]
MKRSPGNLLVSLAHWGLLGGAALFVLVFIVVAGIRMGYPFELEWTEGRMLDHVARSVAGEKIYVRPTLDFVPIGYPALYYYACVVAARIAGVGFYDLRAVSFLSTLGCAVALFLFIRREKGSRFAALLGAALYLATYRASGGYLDAGRVDPLLNLLLFAGLFFARFGLVPGDLLLKPEAPDFDSSVAKYDEIARDWAGAALAGTLFALAFLTKQTAVIVAAPVGLHLLFVNRRRGLFFGLAFLLVAGVATWLLNLYYDGWYKYLVFDQVSRHPLREGRMMQFWLAHLLRPLPIASLAGLLFLWDLFSRPCRRRTAWFYVLAGSGFLATGWIGIWSVGGDRNALLPAHGYLALLFGVGFARAIEKARETRWPRPMRVAIYGAAILQFANLVYNPRAPIPTRADREAGWRLVETMKSFAGDVYMPYHGYYPRLAGKPGFAPSYDYASFGEASTVMNELREAIDQAVRERRFDAIIYDDYTLPERWQPYYRLRGPLFESTDVFWPVTGYRIRPRAVFVPTDDNASQEPLER